MPTDLKLMYHKLVEDRSYTEIANQYQLNADSVRGRVNRASKSKENIVQTMQDLVKYARSQDKAIARQMAVVKKSIEDYQVNENSRLIFTTDAHLPHCRWDAVELAMRLSELVKATHMVWSSDGFDFGRYGKWDNPEDIAAQLWGSSIQNALDLLKLYVSAFPNTQKIDVRGNHDNWLFNFLRMHKNGFEEENVAYFMEQLYDMGLLVFSNETKYRSIVKFNNWRLIHGHFTGSDVSITNRIQQLAREGFELHPTMSGHTHHSFKRDTHYNIGWLGDVEKMPYLDSMPKWNLGVGLILGNRGYIVDFYQEGGYLCADFEGNALRVKASHKNWTVIGG